MGGAVGVAVGVCVCESMGVWESGVGVWGMWGMCLPGAVHVEARDVVVVFVEKRLFVAVFRVHHPVLAGRVHLSLLFSRRCC